MKSCSSCRNCSEIWARSFAGTYSSSSWIRYKNIEFGSSSPLNLSFKSWKLFLSLFKLVAHFWFSSLSTIVIFSWFYLRNFEYRTLIFSTTPVSDHLRNRFAFNGNIKKFKNLVDQHLTFSHCYAAQVSKGLEQRTGRGVLPAWFE